MEKKYEKSIYEIALIKVLTQMDAQDIRTLEALQAPENAEIYAALWFAVESFVNYVALNSKNTKTADGKWKDGNASRLRELKRLGVKIEDIRRDIQIRIMEKMDLVLARPVEFQIPYCNTICNTCLVNEWRKLCIGGQQVYSLNYNIGDEDDELTLMDTLTDDYTPEDQMILLETVREKQLAAKEATHREMMQRRETILQNVAQLRKREEVFTYLCSHEKMRPRHITDLLLEQGSAEAADEAIRSRVRKKYAIQREAISALLDKPFTDTSLKLDSGDKDIISAEISRVKNRMPKSVKMSLK